MFQQNIDPWCFFKFSSNIRISPHPQTVRVLGNSQKAIFGQLRFAVHTMNPHLAPSTQQCDRHYIFLWLQLLLQCSC